MEDELAGAAIIKVSESMNSLYSAEERLCTSLHTNIRNVCGKVKNLACLCYCVFSLAGAFM